MVVLADKTKTRLLLGLAVMALTLAGGCAWFADSRDDAPPSPTPFTDVPLPPELSLDEKNTKVYQSSLGRVGILKASGCIGKEELLVYYREAMAQNGWTKDSEFDNTDQHMLIFSKAPRSAAVTVKEGWVYSDVEINVSAKQ